MKLGFGKRIWNAKELEVQKGSKVGELRKQSMTQLSIMNFSKCKSQMKLGFGGRIWNVKELEVQRRSRVG
jgi:hypothetical protein